jgi:hypothetical protein
VAGPRAVTARVATLRRTSVMLVAMLVAVRGLGAQDESARYSDYRADVIVGHGTTASLGGGVQQPLGYYVRLGVIGAAGLTWRDGARATSGRVDVVARYLLDPFREIAWAPSLGGGVSVFWVDGETRVRPYLTLVADVEGPRIRRGTLSPALQVGLGGGARISLALRTSRGRWR